MCVVYRRYSTSEKIDNVFCVIHLFLSPCTLCWENASSIWRRGNCFSEAAFWIFLWMPSERRMGVGTGLCTSATRGPRGYPKEGGRYTSGAGHVSQSAEVRELCPPARQSQSGRHKVLYLSSGPCASLNHLWRVNKGRVYFTCSENYFYNTCLFITLSVWLWIIIWSGI